MKKILCLVFLVLWSMNGYSHEIDKLPSSFFKQKRQELIAKMPDSSVAIFFASNEKNRNNDVDYLYRQNSTMFYFSGFEEPQSSLFLFKNPIVVNGTKTQEVLFIQGRNEKMEVWMGRKYNESEAKGLGYPVVMLQDSLSNFFKKYVEAKQIKKALFYTRPKMPISSELETIYAKKCDSIKIKTESSFSFVALLRQKKEKIELELIRKATNISVFAHKEAMKSCQNKMTERDMKSIMEYIYGMNGCEYTAYPSIVGGGENACTLHYEAKDKVLADGELVLIDAGGEYHNYATDITRTFPVNGKFSLAQLEIYSLVLEAQKEAIKECAPNKEFAAPHKKATEIIKKGLMKLGIIKNEDDYKKYFMHGTSHYVGLDVHDAGLKEPLQAGEVITVEPGIYIPKNSPCDKKYWDIGVRIEDTILITEKGYENLSAALPSEPKDIEAFMKQKGIGNMEGAKLK